ncbi:hypothetical protein GCM10011578_070300 [Streptomyces fuscichromogenes]|uniref:Uncharacterized protein n=2 Tax=Streptomyces fuscichromogenes TaxID=1324013 RepID=A0A917XJC1_9ACTN|nr:hypothetical protein GCM10011578_070300 [Streptomyces fuscichromogenes]
MTVRAMATFATLASALILSSSPSFASECYGGCHDLDNIPNSGVEVVATAHNMNADLVTERR